MEKSLHQYQIFYEDEGKSTKRARHQKQNEPVKGMLLKELSDGSSIYKSMAHNFCKMSIDSPLLDNLFKQTCGDTRTIQHKRIL